MLEHGEESKVKQLQELGWEIQKRHGCGEKIFDRKKYEKETIQTASVRKTVGPLIPGEIGARR